MFDQDEKLILRVIINRRLEELEVLIADTDSKTIKIYKTTEYNRLMGISEKLNSIGG